MSKRTIEDISAQSPTATAQEAKVEINQQQQIGPTPAQAKKQRCIFPIILKSVLEHETLFVENIPQADMYERSLMHRDTVNYVSVSNTDFIITTSIDGHVKFWKKTATGLDFVKHFRSHLGAIISINLSYDGILLATAGADKGLKIFDILNFDMINMIKLNYSPSAICWMYQKGQSQALLACSDRDTNEIHFYDGRGSSDELFCISTIHHSPVYLMAYNPFGNTVVSIDSTGMMEYWAPEKEPQCPKPPVVDWTYKTDTDLYEFKKSKSVPSSLVFSPNFKYFATFGFDDRQIRVFHFKSGKMIRKYDESLSTIVDMFQAKTIGHGLDDMEFARRLALEKDLGKSRGGQSSTVNVVFDETSNFILYPTLVGVKVVNIYTNKVVNIIGKSESLRIMNIALYQGAPKKKALVTLEMATSENPVYKETESTDPTLYVTAYKKNRFYCFSKREPEQDDSSGTARDIFNEKPTREETVSLPSIKSSSGNHATIHTNYGDIHIQLFPEYVPKTVENFVGLAKKKYYDGLLFHRIVKGFMIQTGDPKGDGSGGESLWGVDFEDEFHPALRHDRPYTVSMANMGANTNSSQFFITSAPAPWLDNKNAVFARVTGGSEVIHKIESIPVGRHFRALNDVVKITSIDFK